MLKNQPCVHYSLCQGDRKKYKFQIDESIEQNSPAKGRIFQHCVHKTENRVRSYKQCFALKEGLEKVLISCLLNLLHLHYICSYREFLPISVHRVDAKSLYLERGLSGGAQPSRQN